MPELIWDGKYDDRGRRVAPLRVSLPFQTVETINESAQDRQLGLDRLVSGHDPEWRNRLIWGDNKYVLPSLLEEFAGKVALIYIDPPFNTRQDFSVHVEVGESDERADFVKEPNVIEQKAYRDTWGRGIDSYLQMLNERLILMRELLTDDGSIYVHIGPGIDCWIKVMMEEVFGATGPSAEITWKRVTAHGDSKRWGIIHDYVLWQATSSKFIWNPQHEPHSEDYLKSKYRYKADDGRVYRLDNITSPNPRPNMMYEWRGHRPPTFGWRYEYDTMERLYAEGRIELAKKEDGRPQERRFLDEMAGVPIGSVWTDISPVNSQASEDTRYDTQKPEALLRRIIEASSNRDDLVLDCFIGSGTTAAVAEKLGRRWIACDLGRFAVHTTRKRLLSIPDVRPFVVQNLGKYERQHWHIGEFGSLEEAAHRQSTYIAFMLDLYHARPITGGAWLHGVKHGRMVHVGSVDAPVTVGDITSIAAEFRRRSGTGENAPATNGVDLLGWDFAFELNEVSRQQAEAAKINLRFLRIPREVMDKRAVEQGDIRFFELAALGVETHVKDRTLTLTLTDFVIPPDDVPADVQAKITNWQQWIDYWAVDWDNHSDTFHNQWQSYRTRKDRRLQMSVAHTYDQPGEYTVVVKVIDILGNDTTKTHRLQIG